MPDYSYIEDAKALRYAGKTLVVEVHGEEYLIPHSQISRDSEVQEPEDEGILVIPTWLAVDRGLE